MKNTVISCLILANGTYTIFLTLLRGDHVTLQAAADKFGAQINLITSYEDTICMEILPNERKVDRILWLSFLAEYHYNSVYPIEGEAISNFTYSF